MIMVKNNYLVLRNAALTNFVVELDCILPYLIIFVTAEGETRSMDSRRRMTTNREIICINLYNYHRVCRRKGLQNEWNPSLMYLYNTRVIQYVRGVVT